VQAISAVMISKVLRLNHQQPEEVFFKSQWQRGDKSLNYLIYRWIVAVYFIAITLVFITISAIDGAIGFYFIYLSNWEILLCMFTSTLSAIIVTLNFFDKVSIVSTYKLYWFLSNSSIVLALVIAIPITSLDSEYEYR